MAMESAVPSPFEDQVLAHLRSAEAAYRAEERERARELEELEATRAALAESQAHARLLTAELDAQRWNAERERQRVECLKQAMREIHGALFHGDVYTLILRACLTISGATRGIYVTCTRPDGPLRVRAQIDIPAMAGAAPPPMIAELCREVLQKNDTLVCGENDTAARLHGDEPEGLRFRNCVAAPVVLLANLDGVVLAADKMEGEFDDRDIEALLSVGDQATVAVRNRHLERELQTAYVHTVTMLADAVEAKDPYTHGHCEMASRYARLVAARLGLSEHDQALVCYGALLHDVGKIGVSDGVLNKPGPLLPEEVELMRAHVRVGYDLLNNVPALRDVADVVLRHHEHYDGGGYPDGMRGDDIPMPARIVSVADAYCAMITRRSYKDAYPDAAARAELRRCAGTQFDPVVVDAFLAILDTPESRDSDDDDFAECGLLPGFEQLRAQVTPA
jgi:putative nucleotidyltransferase with HDIG domain